MRRSTSLMMRSDLFPLASMLFCMAAGNSDGQIHSGVVEGRRGMRQDEVPHRPQIPLAILLSERKKHFSAVSGRDGALFAPSLNS